MIKKENMGLVIQGPLNSYGRGGRKAHLLSHEIGKDDIFHFDCRPNIQKIIDEFGELFGAVVVSTWDDQLKPGDGWVGATIASRPDPGSVKKEKISIYSYKGDNKLRQFVGIRHGILALEKMDGIEYVVRVRTDQYVDLQKLLNSFKEDLADERPDTDKVWVPVIHPATFLLHDHYFAARLEALKKFCDAILAFNKFEFTDSVHREMVLKHAYVYHKDVIGVPDWAYFPYSPPNGICTQTKRIFAYMFENLYKALDPEVLRSTSWRGEQFSDEYASSRILAQSRQPKAYSVPALITIDWQRYFTFHKEREGRKPTLQDHVTTLVGKLGWSLWQLIRHTKEVLLRNLFNVRRARY